jgi:predicted ATP-binding protein involved in virulence
MKLKTLEIKNFRCFESLSIDLDKQLTVLVAKNGQGKSSVLDAIRIGLWAFVSGFDLAKNPSNEAGNNIGLDDVRMLRMSDGQMARQFPCTITLKQNFMDVLKIPAMYEVHKWTRSRISEAKGSKTIDDSDSKDLKMLASISQERVRQSSLDDNLPILGYYGTGRLWSQKPLTKKEKQNQDAFMRLFAYRDCLAPASSYKHFENWFIWIFECYREEQIKQVEKGLLHESNSKWKDTILVVQQAINEVLQAETGWHDLEYSISDEKSLVLNHDSQGKLKVEQLSDGIRNTLAMVADIAYRCVKLNWHLGLQAAKETHGIVMIDEIEMHLHPAWQQSILGNLIKAFPNIQFIITTHSPQVISTVAGHQIRILTDNQVHTGEAGTKGAEASRILREVFDVELRAQHLEIVKKLNRYLELIDDDKWDTPDALKLRQELNEWSHGHEPELTKADIDIRMKEFQRQL